MIKNNFILILLFFIVANSYSQTSEQDLVKLSRIYNKFHARTELTNDAITTLDSYKGTDLEKTSLFIKEACTKNNAILSNSFLIKPDSLTLRCFHVIVLSNYNMFKPDAVEDNKYARQLLKKKYNINESIRFYYSTLFTSIGNKNKPFDYSKIDIKLDSLNLTNETQKGIFFLELSKSLGFQAISYVKYAKEPRYQTSYDYFQLLPKINSLPYYKYTYFGFEDVKMMLNRKKQSFKKYYLESYYELLLTHYFCMKNLDKSSEEVNDLLLSSLLRERRYYDYCKDRAILERIFKKVD